jgi:hypothetical protein
MPLILRTALILLLPMLSGCIAVLPISEYVPTTTGGVVNTSNCVGRKSVQYDFNGVPLSIFVRSGGVTGGSSDSPQLLLRLPLDEGQTARFSTPEFRIKTLDGTTEEGRTLPAWERIISRAVKPNSKRYERVTVETVPIADALVGAKPNDGADVMLQIPYKIFSMSIPLGAAASGYRVTLPTIEINGKPHTIAPIEYQKQLRLEFMVPINC